MSRDANWGYENAISREKGIAAEEERKTKEARNKVGEGGIRKIQWPFSSDLVTYRLPPKVEDLKKKLKAKRTAATEVEVGLKKDLPLPSSEAVVE